MIRRMRAGEDEACGMHNLAQSYLEFNSHSDDYLVIDFSNPCGHGIKPGKHYCDNKGQGSYP